MSAGAEADIAVAQRGQLGDAQAGLDRHQQQRVIASAEPAGAVRRREQRLDLVFVEVGDQRAVDALGRDLDHTRDRLRVFWVPQ